jgi:PIN domain nuclease of toxin-antitoxin system
MNAAVTDSRALIWYAIGPNRRLGRRARELFARAERGQAFIYIPVIVLVEVAEAIHRGAIQCQPGFTRWSHRLFASGRFVATDLTMQVVVEAESLYAIPERGDRLIAATALSLESPLITNDPAIARIPTLTTIW